MSNIIPENPEQLKLLSVIELEQIAAEIRKIIIETCLKNGGHIGASLGAVEIAVALHAVFHSPEEPIIWDVGHQAYAHKLLTGRKDQFHTLRQLHGLSGFLSRQESEHDLFGAGHSSTALSAAIAIAWAHAQKEDSTSRQPSTPWTIAVVGDGSLTAGISFEALNQIANIEIGPLLIILNDNQLSISENIGAIPKILAQGQPGEYFKNFGIDYKGPFDGHDLNILVDELKKIKGAEYSKRPILLHLITKKGKGYLPAESSPIHFHGISPSSSTVRTYSQAFGDAICQLAQIDPRVVAITAAMSEGTGLEKFRNEFPKRFFDVGIAEAHAVTFAAGLATQGYRPVVAIYSTFLQRALDSLIHDVALQNLGVTLAIDRAGLVGPDGPTHHGSFDLSYLSLIPNFKICSPSCLSDLSSLLAKAVQEGTPWAIRYPRGTAPENLTVLSSSGMRFHNKVIHPKVIFVAVGHAASKIQKLIEDLEDIRDEITFISTTAIKPFSVELISYLNAHSEAIMLTLELGAVRGGFGTALIPYLERLPKGFEPLGYPDHFIEHGTIAELEEENLMSSKAIESRIRKYCTL